MTTIYALHDPTDVSRRVYVGKTIDPRRRHEQHCNPRRHGPLLHRRWVGKMLARGVRPEMVVLEVVSAGGDWQEAERFWIESFRAMGMRTANVSPGGENPGGGKPTEEARRNMSLAQLRQPRWALSPAEIATLVSGAPPKKPGGRRSRGATGYRGVARTSCKIKPRYLAQICLGGVPLYLGVFDSPEDAARAYDIAARAAWGPAADLNFPAGGEVARV